jgi:cold shock CspA family protein
VDFDSLQEGDEVLFDLVDSPKGPRVHNLHKAS